MPISSHRFQGLLDHLGDRSAAPDEGERATAVAGRDVEVLQHRELLEHGGGLERPAHAEPGDPVHLATDELLTGVSDRPGGRDEPGHGVDERGLAGAVGPDEEPQVAGQHREVHAVDGHEPVEADGEP
jgi:hypothetical protein